MTKPAKKASKKRSKTIKPITVGYVNKLSEASQEALQLSSEDVYAISQWWKEYVVRTFLKEGDGRFKDANAVITAMDTDDKPMFRFEIYHHLVKQDEYFENSIEGVMKVIHGSEEEGVEGLGIDWWDKPQENVI